MALSSCSSVQSSFPDPSQMHEKLKKVVWSIKIVEKVKEEVNEQPFVFARGCGFSVTPNGYIMTSASIFVTFDSNMEIKARRLDQDTFIKAKLKLTRPQWDLALLKIKVGKLNVCECASFSEDGTLRAGQPILTIGRTSNFVGSCRYGNSAVGCTQRLPRLNRNRKCEDHFYHAYFYNTRSSNTLNMGCFWNMHFFATVDPPEPENTEPEPENTEPEPENTEPEPENIKLYEFERQIHPHVPVIQCDSFSTNHDQCFGSPESQGSPVFNLTGEIVGMLSSKFHNFDIAIHVSALLRFKTDSLSVGPVFRCQRSKRKAVLQRKRRKRRLGKFHMLGIRRT